MTTQEATQRFIDSALAEDGQAISAGGPGWRGAFEQADEAIPMSAERKASVVYSILDRIPRLIDPADPKSVVELILRWAIGKERIEGLKPSDFDVFVPHESAAPEYRQ